MIMMMRRSTSCCLLAVVVIITTMAATSATFCNAFTQPLLNSKAGSSFLSNTHQGRSRTSASSATTTRLNIFGRGRGGGGGDAVVADVVTETTGLGGEPLLDPQAFITPEGFGFTTPMSRVLRERSPNQIGYYKAKASDSVIEVMEALTSRDESGNPLYGDVALVCEDNDPDKVVGLFTESDYIKFSTERSRSSINEEESAQFLVAPIEEHMTSTPNLISLSETTTANVAIAAMKLAGIRHVIVADQVDMSERKLTEDSVVQGVVSMQDVMSIIQKDERLSLTSLALKYPNIRNPVDQMREELKIQGNIASQNPETAKRDVIRAASAVLFILSLVALFSQSTWLHDHANIAMIGIFIMGYIGIIFEEIIEFDKAGVALLMSTGLWVTYADYYQSTGKASGTVIEQLSDQLSEVSDICFFLLAASTIVEVVDAHQGFKVVTDKINTTSKKQLFWIIGFLTFFLSAVLNNLTVTIVMVSLLRKLIPNDEDRRLFGAMVVVAANAGGVWTPIGDVTTTMLWISHQLSTVPTVTGLFVPSVACLVASLAFLVNQVEEDGSLRLGSANPDDENGLLADEQPEEYWSAPLSQRGQLVFWTGIASLLAVPVFNELTGLPPYLAMLTGLGVMWTLTDVIHMGEEDNEGFKVPSALSNLDTAGILFFLGILMSIGVLDKSGLLKELAEYLSNNLPNLDIIATVIGLASAVIDNVPLVAATMGMYELSDFPTDDRLWQLIALCAGTGGSILIIGSASGVALMGLEKVDFLWYAKKVSIGAAVGYFAGIATYLVQSAIISGAGLGLLDGVMPQAAVAADGVLNAGVI